MSDTEAPAHVEPGSNAQTRRRDTTIRIGAGGAPATAAATPATPPRLTRRGRVRKWDRPPQPRDWRFFVGNLGKVLISIGLLMFAFVAYQLWGTAIETAAAQNQLEDEFETQLLDVEPVSASDVFQADNGTVLDVGDTSTDDLVAVDDALSPTTESALDEPVPDADPFSDPGEVVLPPVVPLEDQNIPLLENGDALARIEIPRIGVNDIVVAGVETGDLKRGPGHFPDTPLPGQLGNAAIAGHRTTYGSPFYDVDKLQIGDEIRMTTLSGVFVYRVTGQQIVQPENYEVVSTTDPTRANLTLTSCHPKFTARERIVIFSELDTEASGPIGEPVLNYGRPDEPIESDAVADALPGEDVDAGSNDGGDTLATEQTIDPVTGEPSGSASGNLDSGNDAIEQFDTAAVNEGIADAFSESWFSDPSANPQVGLWGLVVAAISMAAFALSRRFRSDWIGLAAGLIPFVFALYFFFQNVNRLLPPNL